MKNIIKLLMVVVLFAACDDTESVVFDSVNGQTLASFGASSSDLQVIINESGEREVQVNLTTQSSVDRTVIIGVDEASTASAENYTVPNQVVIPAGSFIGNFTVSGIDNSVETDKETIIINLVSVEGGLVSSSVHTVSLFQVCPVPVEYMIGTYILTDNTTNATPNFLTDEVVTLSVPDGDVNARTFVATILPTTGVARAADVTLSLSCNQFLLNTVDINVTCDTSDPDVGFLLGSSFGSFYDLEDDLVLEVNYTEDVQSDCGPAALVSFTLTKI
jgi:hypothetical protein